VDEPGKDNKIKLEEPQMPLGVIFDIEG
jgi:hypothetical protein